MSLIAGMVGAGLTLVGEIVEIIADKGDDADEVRLKDIPGWEKLKKKCREKEALSAFRRAWRERDNKPDDGE